MSRNKVALITGGSSGIGYEFSKLFARDGYDLVLVALEEENLINAKKSLEELSSVSVKTIPHDLSRPGSAESLIELLQKKGVFDVDVLVNNAGFTVFGEFVETSAEKELAMMNLNMVTLTLLTKHFLKSMKKRNAGKILNISSTAAFQPGPLMAVYYASKSYVLSFTEAIAEEISETGITITALCPGPTASGFQKRGKMESSKLVKDKQLASPEKVAKVGYRALFSGKRVEIVGVRNKFFAQVARITPRKIATQFVYNIQKEQ